MKQLVLILMLSFGATSFAFAQESAPAEHRAMVKDARAANIKQIKDGKRQALVDRDQALEQRAEFKEDLRAQAVETRTELRAQLQAATTTDAREAIKQEAEVKRGELKETAQEYKEQWREKVRIYFQTRIELTFERFAAHIEKANQVDARIVSVVTKLQSAGVDTTEVEASLAAARVNTSATQELMRTVRSNLESAVETGSKEKVRTAFNDAKVDSKEASQSLKLAYLDIRKSIAELKALIETEEKQIEEEEVVKATTTVETQQ